MTKPAQYREGTGNVYYGAKFRKMYEAPPSIVERNARLSWFWVFVVGIVCACVCAAALIVGYAR